MLRMRYLRLRYKIRLEELAHAAGVSHQYISDLELGKRPATPGDRRLVERAFEIVVQDRKKEIDRLVEDCSTGRSCFLDPIEEGTD